MGKIYSRLRLELYKRKITIKKLAEMIQMEESLLYKRLQGHLKFNEEDIYKICIVLDMEPCLLFFDDLMQKLHNNEKMIQ